MTPLTPAKKHRRFRRLLRLLLLISAWQLVQRVRGLGPEPSWSQTPESEPVRTEAPAPPEPPKLQEPQEMPEPQSPSTATARTGLLPEAEFRYAVKWVDGSEGADVPHEKRDLTLKQAQREAGWLAKHNRRFYPGEAGERSPFSHLQVWLQCACGRDVVNLHEPHVVPGEDRICSYSDSGHTQQHDVILASR